ncbi:hypothetical protein U0070_024589, partial [Myodes glareolus]
AEKTARPGGHRRVAGAAECPVDLKDPGAVHFRFRGGARAAEAEILARAFSQLLETDLSHQEMRAQGHAQYHGYWFVEIKSDFLVCHVLSIPDLWSDK